MLEEPNCIAWIKASQEILEELEKDWSEPIRIKTTRLKDGEWDLHLKTVPKVEVKVNGN